MWSVTLSTENSDPSVSAEPVLLLLRELDDSVVKRHMTATDIEKSPDLNFRKSYIVKYFPMKVALNLQ